MTAEEMMEFHELWLTELEAESPGEHAVVLQMLGEGKDVLEAMRHIYAKRGGAAVQSGAAAFKALPKDRAEAQREAAWTAFKENPAILSQSAGRRFKRAAKDAAVRAGMSGGDASSVATGAALPMGHATFAFRQAAEHGLPPPQSLPEAVRAGAQAKAATLYVNAAGEQCDASAPGAVEAEGDEAVATQRERQAKKANKCMHSGCDCTAASPETCTDRCKGHEHRKAAADAGAANRSEAGKDCPSVRALFNGRLVFEARQLSLGPTGLKLFANPTEAAAAGIPACILNSKSEIKRTVIPKDKDGHTVELVASRRHALLGGGAGHGHEARLQARGAPTGRTRRRRCGSSPSQSRARPGPSRTRAP